MKPTPVRRILWVVGILIALGLLMAGLAQAQPVQITDDRGTTVRLPAPPRRIVSLLPSLTESVCALGQCERLVGVDRYSNWPASVRRLAVVGGGLDPSIEAIVALKPDVVLMSDAAKVGQRLESLGVPVVALDMRSQALVHAVLGKLGQLLAVPPEQGAERLWREINAGVDAAAQSIPPEARGARVYFEVSRGPYAAGPSSFIGETLTRLGARNVVPAELGPFPRLSPEFLVRSRPDVILMGHRSMQVAPGYPGWHTLDAVRAQRICGFDEEQSNILVRPGPRMAEAARLIAACLSDKAPRQSGRAP